MKEDNHTRNFIILMVVITIMAIIIAFTTNEEVFPDPTRESFKMDHEKIRMPVLAINQLKIYDPRQAMLPRFV